MNQPQVAAEKPERFSFWYRVARGGCCFLFRTFLPVRYHGAEENAQLDAPYILIANHNSMLDPLIVGCKVRRYQIHFLGKHELVKNPLARAFYRNVRMISVGRGETDMAAMRACLKTLKQGHVLGVFPEGTRHKQGVMENLEAGIGMIALCGNVPLLPAYIKGKPRLFRRLDVYFDEPISIADIAAQGMSKPYCDQVLARIRERYVELQAAHGAPPSAR